MKAIESITAPGVYDIPAEEYHADPVGPAPSLSASIAKQLLDASPEHARWAHPKLSPAFTPEESERFDVGTAAHAYLLEGERDAFEIIDAKDWRTKAAQEARDLARLAGKTPLLSEQWVRVQAMAEAAKRQLAAFEEIPRPLTHGRAEETLVWQEDGAWMRARLDWLHADHRTIDDYKSTSGSAHPDAFIRGPLFALGYDVQAAMYLRGIAVLFGHEAAFRFVVQETDPPYALSVVALGPEALVLAEKKRRRAVELWRACLATGQWPAYPTRTCYAELPAWQESRWLERELRDEMPRARQTAIDDGRPIDEQLAGYGGIL